IYAAPAVPTFNCLWDIARLTSKALNLAPSQHTEGIFKQILGGCQSVVEGLGALRNRLSDAHGTGRRAIKPAPRHAELAVNLSGALALYLLETFLANNTRLNQG
ncbi:abortive infection family protein, partial [Burkholderia cenocepacia]